MGPLGRLYSIGVAVFYNQSDLGYVTLSSPAVQALLQSLNALKHTATGKDPLFYWMKAAMTVTPGAVGNPLKSYALHQANPKYEPRHGEEFQDWIENA